MPEDKNDVSDFKVVDRRSFAEDGSSITTLETGEILWLQLFDLNEDGIAELITEEVEGRGTGILTKIFRLYVVSPVSLKKAWEAESFMRSAPWKPRLQKPSLGC